MQEESPTTGNFSREDLILFWPPEGSNVIFPYIKILKNWEIIGYNNVLIKDTSPSYRNNKEHFIFIFIIIIISFLFCRIFFRKQFTKESNYKATGNCFYPLHSWLFHKVKDKLFSQTFVVIETLKKSRYFHRLCTLIWTT